MLVVGLTGGIGAGKSTVAELFARLGALVIDADQLARMAIERGSDGFADVMLRFGEDVIINGDIDLSVASTLAASAGVLAKLFESGVPIFWCCVASIFTGLVLGLINGLIVIKLGLPSLVVTLATLALYRGLTQVILGDGVVARLGREPPSHDHV